ncbi:putative dehydrogenase [Planctomycetales bacterium 10988]|nr:putative dehydrogenase [Planctomycetales bacterium 10988]
MQENVPLRVGLIGVGGIARGQHLPGWAACSDVEVVAVADVSEEMRTSTAEKFNIPHTFSDYREMLSQAKFDIVDICAPSALHARMILDSLAAGCHVLCEKPMATCFEDAQKILAALHKTDRKLMIAQQFRYDPMTLQLRKFLADLNIGDIYYTRAQWLRRRFLPGQATFTQKHLSGGGPLYDLGVHLIDLAWWMMGNPQPTHVSGGVYNLLAKRTDLGSDWTDWNPETMDVEDFAAGTIRFENGSILSLETSWLAFQPEAETTQIQWFGSKGGFQWPQGTIVGETNRIPWDTQIRKHQGTPAHTALILDYVKAIREERPVPIDPVQSAQIIQLLDAMYQSAEKKQEITLPKIDAE